MMRRRRIRLDIENNNFKRQAQTLAILPIATVILGGTLFQTDISINHLFSTTQLLERLQGLFVCLTAVTYIVLLAGASGILVQTTRVRGEDIIRKIMDPMLLELLFAILALFIEMLST